MSKQINIFLEHLLEKIKNYRWYNDDYISDSTPVIIGGCARSGTTLIRVMIDSHKNIYCGPETGLLYTKTLNPTKIKKISNQLEIPYKELVKMKQNSVSNIQFIEMVFNSLQKQAGKKRWGEKSPMNILAIDRIFKYFPKTQFIHIIRDGRDTSCSLRHFPKHKVVDGEIIELDTNNPLKECIERWVHDVQEGIKWRGDPRYYEIKYEDLIRNPEETIRHTLSFLKEPWDENILNYYKIKSPTRKKEKMPKNIKARKPIDQSSYERWRNEYNEHDKELFKKIAGELLIELKYEKDNNW